MVHENPTVNMFEAPGAEGDESPDNNVAPETDANVKGDTHMDDEGADGLEDKAEQAYAGVSKEPTGPLQDKDGDEFKSDEEPESNVLKNPYYLPEDEDADDAQAE